MARKIEVEIIGDSSSLTRAFSRSSHSAKRWNSDLLRAGRGAVVASVGFRGLGRSIAFASAAFVGGAGLTAALKNSVEGFIDFEHHMQQAAGLAGVAQDQIKGFSKEVLDLSVKIGKSPQELAQGFYYIASSGIAASKAMNVLEESAKLSVAGLGKTDVVADALTSSLNAYGEANLSAADAADVLAAVVREGKGEADRFAPVIGNVVALASQLGVEFDEVGAALASQTRLGTDAETTAIQLQRVFSTLLKITPKSEKAFEAVGLNARQLAKDLGNDNRGLLYVLQLVKSAFVGQNADENLANAFGDVRALRGILNLVGSQMPQVIGVFDRFQKRSKSAETAFGSAAGTIRHQFDKMKASAEVAGVAIGAIFAPIAGKVAAAMGSAAVSVAEFFTKLKEHQTTQGKIEFIVSGAQDIGKKLQARIERIDFGKVGDKIGSGIATAIEKAVPATEALITRLNEIFSQIPWEEMGRKIGPGLATAIVTAFVTLTDPAFWIKNWDLALAVALTAFGGSVGRIAGAIAKDLIRPFVRFAPEAGKAIVGGFKAIGPKISNAAFNIVGEIEEKVARFAPNIARLLTDALLAVPRLLRSLLTRPVERIFNALGRKTQFLVKVLGIKAAIDAIVGFATRVKDTITGLVQSIPQFFRDMWDNIEKRALKAALRIIEPFSHIPKKLGGGTFQDLKDKWKLTLSNMEGGTKTSVATTQSYIDTLHGKDIAINIKTNFTGMQPPYPARGGGGAGSGGDAGGDGPKPGKDTAAQVAAGKAAAAAARAAAARAKALKLAKERAEKAKVEALKAFTGLMDALSLKELKATATKGLQDDIAAQKDIQAAIRKRIAVEGETTELMRMLFESQQKVVGFQQDIAENKAQAIEDRKAALEKKAANRKRRQFVAIGLTPEGDERTASAGLLLKKAGKLEDMIKGTFLDTPKTRNKLKQITAFLKANLKGLSKDVRSAIAQMLAEINGALDQEDPLELTRKRLTAGRGKPSISAFGFNLGAPGLVDGPKDGPPIIVNVTLDGKEIGNVIIKDAQGRNRRTVSSRTGRHSGSKLF